MKPCLHMQIKNVICPFTPNTHTHTPYSQCRRFLRAEGTFHTQVLAHFLCGEAHYRAREPCSMGLLSMLLNLLKLALTRDKQLQTILANKAQNEDFMTTRVT